MTHNRQKLKLKGQTIVCHSKMFFFLCLHVRLIYALNYYYYYYGSKDRTETNDRLFYTFPANAVSNHFNPLPLYIQ